MNIKKNIHLKNYLTMRLGGSAKYLAEVSSLDDVEQALELARNENLSWFVIGGGSNIIAHDETYEGLIIHPRFKGFEIIEETDKHTTIKIASGEIWDEIVAKTVDMGLQGIEAMSAIPGLVGGAPVQNVGAYGQEIADTFVELQAYDTATNRAVTLSKSDCEFGYRSSIFRESQASRYIISSITISLSKSAPTPPFYNSLQNYLDKQNIQTPTLMDIRQAVTAIRSTKLPDPRKVANTGSFFKNTFIDKTKLDELLSQYPNMPHFYISDNSYKIPTGWLIEATGIRGEIYNGMRINPDNALVLINESATGYGDLEKARKMITSRVEGMFGVIIHQEPLEL